MTTDHNRVIAGMMMALAIGLAGCSGSKDTGKEVDSTTKGAGVAPESPNMPPQAKAARAAGGGAPAGYKPGGASK